MADQTAAEAKAEADKQTAMNAARSAAISRLREAHLDEYHGYLREEASNRGVEWAPRMTPEQKAAAEMRRLLEEFPHLRDQVAGVLAPTPEVPTPDSAEPPLPGGQTATATGVAP